MAIDPSAEPYILDGRIVTMGPQGTIASGRVYIQNGEIRAVQEADAPRPDGFAGAPVIRTGDTIYPGLIELHNHLSYNAMPLWEVPRKFSNNGQWRGGEDYRRRITKPSQVLGRTDGVLQALVRFVECRAMLGGVTTSQGISLASAGGITKFYRGLVRNVEQPLDPKLPRAGTKIANPSTGGAASYLDKLAGHTCYLQHLSEGTDDTARGWFERLRLGENDWAITDALCGIHSTALREEDFAVMASRGASMVWSPLSNYLLYGETADLQATRNAGIQIGLGCDWAPSGSKNLLGELKVAWLASQDQGGVYTQEEIVAMATINPARIAKWDDHLGSIEATKCADLVVVNGKSDDPFAQLIEARETSVTLVVIGGIPRVGQQRLMKRFDLAPTETLEIGSSTRKLYVKHEGQDDLLGDLSLSDATDTLADAMSRLPELAVGVDSAHDQGLFGGSVDAGGTAWRIQLDFDDDDVEIEQGILANTGINLGAQPYSFWVSSMTLDPITVADDSQHLRTLVAARNLPATIKEGLPPLYGESIPIPDSASFLETSNKPIAPQLLESTRDLRGFLRTFGELSLDDRKRIVQQALVLLEENYVHLPLKRAMHAVDPVQRLRLLRHRLEEQNGGTMPPEIEFHQEVMDIFNSLRDLHTNYRLPLPFLSRVAWLPFLIEQFSENEQRRYLVSKVLGDAGPASFVPGVEVTHWNGMTIEQAVARNADRQAGSNPDARHARGLNSLTIRPLARSLPPDEEWVTLRYKLPQASGDPDAPQEFDTYEQEWLVFEPGSDSAPGPADLVREASALGLDDHTDGIQAVRKVLYAPRVALAETQARGQKLADAMPDEAEGVPSQMPGVFRAQIVRKSNAEEGDPEYGYVRIFTFHVPRAEEFVDEFVRLSKELPENGLIIDVRGNGGGLIYAAEQLLQTLTPRRIEPERAQFINTPLNLQICCNHEESTRFAGLQLEPWVESIRKSVQTGATYSHGFPITSERASNAIGQRYYGPVVLVTDPLCYSATDMFAAGFQDHGVGKVIGVYGNTGAGGANVWSHSLLRQLMLPDNRADPGPSPYEALAKGADMRVAIRRTVRVADNRGDVLEDIGVAPDLRYELTQDDLLHRNRDLIDRAIDEIAIESSHSMKVSIRKRSGQLPEVKLRARNVTHVDATVRSPEHSFPEQRFQTREVSGGRATIDLEDVLPRDTKGTVELEIFGTTLDTLVFRRIQTIHLG